MSTIPTHSRAPAMPITTGRLRRSKTPMSSVSGTTTRDSPVHASVSDFCVIHTAGITLLIRIIWYRSKAKINLLFGYTSPETISTCKPAFYLPLELVEMIIDHLIYDLRALKACSLTCFSWYIAAAPHLHHTITFKEKKFGIARAELKPLPKLHKLGILPLAKEVRVCQSRELPLWFTPPAFSRRDLHRFSAFRNVQKLQLERLDIFCFIPGVERYFGQFSPTLRSIALFAPRCTPRQLSYFLSLFSHLDDVEIRGFSSPPATTPVTEPVPVSAPRLRGRLVVSSFREVETWKDLMNGGRLRFHDVDLRNVADCAPVLLEACSKTLETLRFFPADAIGEYIRTCLPRSRAHDKQRVPPSHHSLISTYHASGSFGLYISSFAQSLWDPTAMLAMPSWRSSRPSHPRRSPRLLSPSTTRTSLPYSRACRSSTRCAR